MPNNDPDGKLVALRERIEQWLIDHGEYWDVDQEIAANNITLWAMEFIKVTDEEAIAAGDRLRKQGAVDFVERVKRSAQEVMEIVPGVDPVDTTARAYALEVLRLHDLA